MSDPRKVLINVDLLQSRLTICESQISGGSPHYSVKSQDALLLLLKRIEMHTLGLLMAHPDRWPRLNCLDLANLPIHSFIY